MRIGDKIYVPNKKLSNYSIQGGLATIRQIKELSTGFYIYMEETGNIGWEMNKLIENQDQCRRDYHGQIATMIPEDFERDGHLW